MWKTHRAHRTVWYWIILGLFVSTSKCQRPDIISPPKSHVWKIGSTDHRLLCLARPHENVRIKWKKNGRDVSDGGHISITQDVLNDKLSSSLIFRKAQKSDEGDYQCVAYKGRGSSTSTKASLTIIGPPSVNSNNPLPKMISVSWHDELSLQCDGKGPPAVTKVEWSYKAFAKYQHELIQVMIGRVRRRLTNPALITLPREDDAMHKNVVRYEVFCTVWNEQGSQRSRTTLINIKRKPDTPDIDQIVPLDLGTAISLTWKSRADGYDAMLCSASITGKNSFTWKLTDSTEPGIHKSFISGFIPSSHYSVRIRCHNSIGYSDWSEEKSFLTKEGKPASTPVNVSVAIVNSTSLKVSWQPIPPGNQNGKLIGYKVRWEASSAGSSNIAEAAPDDTEIILNGLRPGETYSVSMWGYSSVGKGPNSTKILATLPLFDDVIPPEILVSDISSREATFSYSDKNDRKGSFQNCSIILSDGIHDITVKISFLDGSKSRSLRALMPNTKYQVKIGCDSYKSERIYSDVKNFRTAEGRPGRSPSNIELNAENGTLEVTWTPVVEELNGNLSQYNICIVASRMNDGLNCVRSASTYARFSNLQPRTTYTVYVSACTKAGCGPKQFAYVKTANWEVLTTTAKPPNGATSPNGNTVLHSDVGYFKFIYVAIAVLSVAIIGILVAMCCKKRAKQKKNQRNVNGDAVVTFRPEPQYEVPLLSTVIPRAADGRNEYYTIPTPLSTALSKETAIKLDDVKFDSDKVTLKEVVGKGEFGRVYKGEFAMSKSQGGSIVTQKIEVAVKTMIMHEYDASEYEEFVKEGLRMKDMDHPNVMKLLGICLPSEGNSNSNNARHILQTSGLESISPLVIVPFMSNGDLKHYLYNARINDETKKIGLKRLMQFACDISCGMEYLAAKNMVHRDLACRNCMLDSKLNVVVSDFGLSRQIYSSSYYVQKRAAKMPVKWMAIESLMDRLYTTMTDVWAFGVTAWEIFTFCQNPFPGVENHEMLELLKAGTRLKRPNGCPNDVWNDAIYPCWDPRPDERPTFTELAEMFSGFKKFCENEPDGDSSENPMYVNMEPPDGYEKLKVVMPRTNTVSSENNEAPIPYETAVERLPSGKIIPKRDRSSSKKPLLDRMGDSDSENSGDVVDL